MTCDECQEEIESIGYIDLDSAICMQCARKEQQELDQEYHLSNLIEGDYR